MSTEQLPAYTATDELSEPAATAKGNVNQIASLWPILFVAFGGLLGLLMGGIAAVINTQIMKSAMPAIVKYPLVVLTGVIALFGWVILVMLLDEAVA